MKLPLPKNIKHSAVVAGLARLYLNTRTSGLEKVIFTATTGRSGTHSLQLLFSAIPGCLATHEPYPNMHDQWLRAASYGNTDEVRRYYERVKAINIRRAAIGSRYYVELNHLFLKTFIEYAAEDFGDRMEVLHVVRPAVEVARSIYHLRDWPGTADGNRWWLDYTAPTNLIQISDLLEGASELSHPFCKALWYWYEMEARVRLWRSRLPNIRFHRFETHWINDRVRTFALLDGLDIEYDKELLSAAIGVKESTKEQRTEGRAHERDKTLTHEVAHHLHERFRQALKDRNLLPDPALQ